MARLNADMKAIVKDTLLCFTATIGPDGAPNVSPKSSLSVQDDEHLVFANIASPGTIRNLQRDPRIEINCVDIFARRGYRFKGRATIHSPGDPLHQVLKEAMAHEHGDKIPVHHAVRVKVHEARPLLSPAYSFVEGVTEDALRTSYAGKYGVAFLDSQEN